MIKSIKVKNYLGDSIVLELTKPEKTGIYIYNIEGLGPSNAEINFKELATEDGSVYNSARVTGKNIVLTLGLLPKPTVEDSRQLVYKYFPIKKPLTFTIETDNRAAEIVGYVESNEPVIFSKTEYTQISIVCASAYFYSANEKTLTTFSGVESAFEFPFSNESLTENLIEFGRIYRSKEQVVPYYGDSEVGIVITMHAFGNVSNISIYNIGTRERMRIDTDKLAKLTGSGLVSGDELIISTVKNDKYVRLLRGGYYTNVLNALDRDSAWFLLSKGDNVFAYDAEEGSEVLEFKIENRILYEGV